MVLALLESAVEDVRADAGEGRRSTSSIRSAEATDGRQVREGCSFIESLTESVFRIFADWGEGMRY